MTTPTFPSTVKVQQAVWQLVSNTQTSTSPLSGAVKTYELPGARWMVSLTTEDLSADTRAYEAFLVALRGASGRFLLWNHARPSISGIGTGTPVVVNSGSTKTALKTSGWTASKTGILLPGDFIGVNGELKMIIESTDSDSSGDATLTVEPPLREIPDDDAAITLSKPTAKFMLVDGQQAKFSYQPAFGSYAIQAVEDIT